MCGISVELLTIPDPEQARCLPNVSDQELEKNGALFSMNRQA